MVELLEQECNKTLEHIKNNLSNTDITDIVDIEQKLWKTIIKIYKENSNSLLINYLIGYYHMLHEVLFFHSPSADTFLQFSRYGYSLSSNSDSDQQTQKQRQQQKDLLYNIHIRLGDLNRYVDARQNAKLYYHRALQIDPKRGIAYNQLSLCTPLTKAYQCLYYSVRAYHCPVDPVKQAAENNIRLSIRRLDSFIFERFRSVAGVKLITQQQQPEQATSSSQNSKGAIIKMGPPESGQEWFYLIVISIHFNELNLTLDMLLDEILKLIDETDETNFKTTLDFDYLLMSLDVALDWIMKDLPTSSQMKPASSFNIETTLKTFNNRFHTKQQTQMATNEELTLLDSHSNFALIHNLILKDFHPLQDIYQQMEHYYESEHYQIDKHRKILVARLIFKLQKFSINK